MTKPKTKAGGSAPKPRSRNSNPKWFRDLAGEPKDFRRAIWQAYLGRKKQKRGDQ